MPAKDHPSYKEEYNKSKYVLDYVKVALDAAIKRKDKMDSEIGRIKKQFSWESSQDYVELVMNSMLQGSLELKLRNLKAAMEKPYFGRVDFKEDNKKTVEKLYIGKVSLMRDEDQSLLIVDWRAPIANLYYEERLGEATYSCPDGDIRGELILKRQFSFDKGELKEVFDIDITTNDEFLQSYLGASADNRLKDIVSTIQAEQNQIIRADMWTPLIVQGAAGSGKTTIALHRIAYLIYTYEKEFKPENFMIIAPNKLFLNYISEVLPELGVEKVKQTTFEDFALELIGKKLKLRDANEKLITFVEHNVGKEQIEHNGLIKKVSEFKASMLFKEIIDEYIKSKEATLLPKEDFCVASKVLFKYEEINNLFLKEYSNWPVMQRLNEIKKHLNNRLKTKKESIINQLYDQCDEKISKLKIEMEDSEDRQKLIIDAINRRDEIIKNLETHSKKAINDYMKKTAKVNPYEYYKDMLSDSEGLLRFSAGKVEERIITFTGEYSSQVLKSGYAELEDLAPIIYIKLKMYGMDEKIPVKHIVIDEAQDFSVFQLYVLKNIIKDSSFTILGDLAQGIHSYRGTKSWEDVREQVFCGKKSKLLLLEQSYRTTVEIMEAANKVIKCMNDSSIIAAKPVIRHGNEPELIRMQSMDEIAKGIGEKIDSFEKKGYKTIAVICKTMDECNAVWSRLRSIGSKPVIITGKEKEYKGGIVIVPSYLAKGLEFDAVIIANAAKEIYPETDLDIKLLYVAMTRPLHELCIYYCGELTSLLA
ncbi:MAG: AAA family ATPase [Clostridia bacterium]|nr:AAA family ATPase [Clostridia bacterium]